MLIAPARSIPEVISRLQEIIEWCRTHNSRMGYFAVLYQRMTAAVLDGIQKKAFDDGERMTRLDIIFANRYLTAWDAYLNKKPCSESWKKTFESASNESLTVLQHLLLGINTHINLDLGIAAAETSPGNAIHHLQEDFLKINVVIATLSKSMQDSLTRIWFPLKTITRLANGREDAVINFSLSKAREASWINALTLSLVDGTARDNYINIIDDSVVIIADRIINPGIGIRLLLHPVRAMEPQQVKEVIDLLSNTTVENVTGLP